MNDGCASCRNVDGSSTRPENFGPTIHSVSDETAGDISPDGKYLFLGKHSLIYNIRPNCQFTKQDRAHLAGRVALQPEAPCPRDSISPNSH